MNQYTSILDWIDTQEGDMIEHLLRWSNINSHTFNPVGVNTMIKDVKTSFESLDAEIKEIEMPLFEWINSKGESERTAVAPSLLISKRKEAPNQALLMIHMDTVYSLNDSFQEAIIVDDNTIKGPGVSDAKGGIVIILKVLQAIEQSPLAEKFGWKVLLNTDEEIGSVCSEKLIENTAKKCDIGLIFEPCLPDGHLIGERKGSGNFSLIARGKAAHAGRDFTVGKNAIEGLAECISRFSKLTNARQGLTVNCGIIRGGSAVNVVPDLAIARFNVRIQHKEDQDFCFKEFKALMSEVNKINDVEFELYGGFSALPKLLKGDTLELFRHVQSCAMDLDLHLDIKNSGGVCDGNRLAAVGLPNVDTMGVQGGHIHSHEEYVLINSLTKRAQLAALTLLKWANGEWALSL